ncbi:hypothetical protein SprV_0100437300 [Sparganum proliferum]
MGSPISGLIAEAVLQRLESLVFRHHRPKFWARYVDDTFVVIERDQRLTFKEQLNAIFPDIQFTMEEEENNQLAFLDVLVCRKDCGGLKTKVFRKATNTTQILNFNSNHPISHKRSCVRALYRRVETHCSEMEDKVAKLQYLRRVMRANGYPRNFVNQCMRKGHQRPNPTGPKFWRALPYVKNVSDTVSRLLTPLGVGVAHRPEATIRRQIMRPKDPLPRQETSGVVYRIWCSCGQSNYVGETGRLLRTRIAEHAAAVRRGDANSQVAAHSTGPGHIFKFQEAEILARGDNRVSRELLESWFSGPQSINKHNDLPVPYSVLRFSLGRRISHVGRTRASNHHGDSEPVCRAIVTPASSTDDEIAAINNSDSDRQATTASITTPAVHKNGAPLRPIVSLKGTPTYGLAKWLFRRLKFLTAESDATVSSSAQFLEKLKGDLAIVTIELLLQSKYDETENRPGHAQIVQLLKFCLRTYFTFDGTIYEQVKGTPMGSPNSGFIAEAVLQRLESLEFEHHNPKF